MPGDDPQSGLTQATAAFAGDLMLGLQSSVSKNFPLSVLAAYFAKAGISPKVYYASSFAVADSNLATGGGTDNTAAFQSILNLATSANPVKIIVDGAVLPRRLTVPDAGHVTIEGLGWDTGFYLKNATNEEWLTNAGLYATPANAAGTGANVTLRDLRLNFNRANQTNVNRNPQFGVWLAGFDGVLFDHVWFHDAPAYLVALQNCRWVKAASCRFEQPARLGGQDGLHLLGGCFDVEVTGSWFGTGDDAVAFNADEGGFLNGSGLPVINATNPPNGASGLQGSAGARLAVVGCAFKDCRAAWLRVYGRGATAQDVVLSGCSGDVYGRILMCGEINQLYPVAEEAVRNVTVSDITGTCTAPGNASSFYPIFLVAPFGTVKVNNVHLNYPTRGLSFPFCSVYFGGSGAGNQAQSSLTLHGCSVHRGAYSAAGGAAGDGEISLLHTEAKAKIGNLIISDCAITVEQGYAAADQVRPAVMIDNANTAIDRLSITNLTLNQVQTALQIKNTGGSSPAPVVTDLTINGLHQQASGGQALNLLGGTVTRTRLDAVHLTGGPVLASFGGATLTTGLTGGGVLESGQALADANVGNGTFYVGSGHGNALCYKDYAGVAHTVNLT